MLHPILSLGRLFVSDFVDDAAAVQKAERAPLDLVLCDVSSGGCGLLQLKHTVSPKAMYRNYWYRSGVNRTMTEELTRIAHAAEAVARLGPRSIVVDIGCNDGTLLRAYQTRGLRRVGFEPAKNLAPYAAKRTSKIFNAFFAAAPFMRVFGAERAKVITAIAMFYDLDDPDRFVADAARVLHPEGVFIIQMSYLPLMLLQNAFDNICHEHIEYYALAPLEHLLTRHGLEVFDVDLNDVNGGSFRTYIRHIGSAAGGGRRGAAERLERLRLAERRLRLHTPAPYRAFAKRVEALRIRTAGFVKKAAAAGKKVYVYGASTKGNTLLQYYGLDSSVIPAAAERNPAKWGKKTIGTHIPIVSEEQARAERPDYFLVLPWHFLPEFLDREKEFRAAGGKFIVPLPKFRVI